MIAAMALLILALALPRWGPLAGPPPAPGHDVVLMIDVSNSMGVEDAIPNRLRHGRRGRREHGQGPRPGTGQSRGRRRVRRPRCASLSLDRKFRGRSRRTSPSETGVRAAGRYRSRRRPRYRARRAGTRGTRRRAGDRHFLRWRRPPESLGATRRPPAPRISSCTRSPSATPTRITRFQFRLLAASRPSPFSTTVHPFARAALIRRSRRLRLRTEGSIVRLGLASGDLGRLYQSKIEPSARRRRESARPADGAERFPSSSSWH